MIRDDLALYVYKVSNYSQKAMKMERGCLKSLPNIRLNLLVSGHKRDFFPKRSKAEYFLKIVTSKPFLPKVVVTKTTTTFK